MCLYSKTSTICNVQSRITRTSYDHHGTCDLTRLYYDDTGGIPKDEGVAQDMGEVVVPFGDEHVNETFEDNQLS